MTWWGVDVLGYVLGRLEFLAAPATPLNREECKAWIARTSIPWARGVGNLDRDIPWSQLSLFNDDLSLIRHLLDVAADEAFTSMPGNRFQLRHQEEGLAATRRLPLSTLSVGKDLTYSQAEDSVLSPYLHDGCADGHVHQGASLPLDLMLFWMATVSTGIPRLSQLTTSPNWISDGRDFRPEPLIWLMAKCLEPATIESSNVVDAGAASRYLGASWSKVEQQPLLARVGTPLGFPPSQSDLQAAKVVLLASAGDNFVSYLRAETILHNAVTQSRPGLDLFVVLFKSLTDLRRSTGPAIRKKEYFSLAIEQHVRQTPNLTGLELRFGELCLGVGPASDKRALTRDYRDAIAGLNEYYKTSASNIKVTFPLGFIKTGAKPSTNWRYNVSQAYDLTESLIDLLEEYPTLRPFVDGVDVCGEECAAPTWVFTPIFERLSTWAQQLGHRFSFRFHAGEWPWTPLSGLRSIDDFLSMELGPRAHRRIGHGLSLDSDDWRRAGDQPINEVLDDLVWLWSMLNREDVIRNSIEQYVIIMLPTVFGRLGSEVAQEKNAMDLLVEAYRGRTNPTVLRRLGWLGPYSYLSFTDGTPSPGSSKADRLTALALSRLGVEVGPAASYENLVSLALGSNFSLLNLLTDGYAAVRSIILDRVKAYGAIVELCPTSNILTGGRRGYADVPVRKLLDSQLRVTVNTDDPALFHSFLSRELSHVWPQLEVAQRRQILEDGNRLVGNEISNHPRTDALALLEKLPAAAD